MKKKVLILTDHKNHTVENSLYDLSVKMVAHPMAESVDIATRFNSKNKDFFLHDSKASLWATSVGADFCFKTSEHPLDYGLKQLDLEEYDLVWLRLPPPLSSAFLEFIDQRFNSAVIINDPKSIEETGSKDFLVNFSSVCPPMRICKSFSDIQSFSDLFPIVLKPFKEYGGRGIVMIENEKVSSGNESWSMTDFQKIYEANPIDYLAVKFLRNVKQGDKRIVVVNGEILGASLRLPAENSWLCNVAMGGTSNMTEVEPEEEEIIKLIDPILSEKGIVMYGVDTLVGDDGKRVLSEINTTSIGGLPQIAAMRKEPLVEKAIDLIWKFYNNKRRNYGS